MWSHVAEAVKLPERDVETLVWQMGRWEIARRAARTAPQPRDAPSDPANHR